MEKRKRNIKCRGGLQKRGGYSSGMRRSEKCEEEG